MSLSHCNCRTTPQKEWSDNLAGENMHDKEREGEKAAPQMSRPKPSLAVSLENALLLQDCPLPDSKDSGIIYQEDARSLCSLLNLGVYHKPVKKLSRQ